MSLLLKLICRFNTTLTKILADFTQKSIKWSSKLDILRMGIIKTNLKNLST